MFSKARHGTSSMRSAAVKPWGNPVSHERNEIGAVQRNRWVHNVQRLYGVDRGEAESVVEDVIQTIAVVGAAERP